MKKISTGPRDFDEYIAGFPKDVQRIMRTIRLTVRKAAPGAKESISYGMPAFTLQGGLLSYAAYQKHIGMYPAPNGVKEFKKDLARYHAAKSTLRFPLDEPIPYAFITRFVRFRVKENRRKDRSQAR